MPLEDGGHADQGGGVLSAKWVERRVLLSHACSVGVSSGRGKGGLERRVTFTHLPTLAAELRSG